MLTKIRKSKGTQKKNVKSKVKYFELKLFTSADNF